MTYLSYLHTISSLINMSREKALDTHPQLKLDHGTTGDAQLGRPHRTLVELRSGDILHDVTGRPFFLFLSLHRVYSRRQATAGPDL